MERPAQAPAVAALEEVVVPEPEPPVVQDVSLAAPERALEQQWAACRKGTVLQHPQEPLGCSARDCKRGTQIAGHPRETKLPTA
ncbi:MAG: hypothetical protein ACKVHP_10910, partial [Verrucomicrobiales bacterium]